MKYDRIDRYKYRVLEDVSYRTTIVMDHPITGANGFVSITHRGLLKIRDNYLWDGDSGPIVDSPKSMRASVIHDALYQLLREGKINKSMRSRVDTIYLEVLIEDGIPAWRARLRLVGLTLFGGFAARRRNVRRERLQCKHTETSNEEGT